MAMQVLAQVDRTLSGNPYTQLLYESLTAVDTGIEVEPFTRRGLLSRHDIVHIHWPEQAIDWDGSSIKSGLQVARMLLMLRFARLRGASMVWTGHDLGPHEGQDRRLPSAYFELFVRQVDHLISLSEDGERRVLERFPVLEGRPRSVVPHGHYRSVYTAAEHAQAATAGPPRRAVRILLLGQIRPYKGLPALVRAHLATSTEAVLTVAGAVHGSQTLKAEIVEAASGSDRVRLLLGAVTREDLVRLHAESDVVVLPYLTGSALHSGALFTALSLDVPVVARRTATTEQIQQQVGAEWVGLFEGDAANALEAGRLLVERTRVGRPDLEPNEWDAVGRATYAAYRTALHADARGLTG